MAERTLPTPNELRQLLRYEPETGKLFWRRRAVSLFASPSLAARWNTKFAGKEAFVSVSTPGYYRGAIWGRHFAAHRVIWAIVRGKWPVDCIDHINGNPKDNRWENLRAVSRLENQKNMRRRTDNTSGVSGVSWCKARQMWQVHITANRKQRSLGRFKNKNEAIAARQAAERAYGFHENHGRR